MNRAARHRIAGAASALALLSGAAAPASAFECHIALVLALDASYSVDPREADLQVGGIAAALRDPVVRAAISPAPNVGALLTVFEWSNPGEIGILAPWTRLDRPAAMDALADSLTEPRLFYHTGQTGVGAALDHAAGMLSDAGARCGRRVIDVSGDGAGNIGPSPDSLRDAGRFDGITINGLVIRNPALDSAQPPGRDPLPYHQRHVRHGPGSFVIVIDSYEDYADGIRQKLLRELAPPLALAE